VQAIVSSKLYRFDAAQVVYFRRVRDCLPREDTAEVRRKLAHLRSAATKIDDDLLEFGKVTAKLVDLQLGRAPAGITCIYECLGDDPEGWKRPAPTAERIASREEWRFRPSAAQALEVWNLFIITLQQEPVRMYRTSAKRLNQWQAEFRRKDGSPMFVSTETLAGRLPKPETDRYLEGSFLEIVDDMIAWHEVIPRFAKTHGAQNSSGNEADCAIATGGLDVAQVSYYRSVRDCLPCIDKVQLRRMLAELRGVAQQTDERVLEFDKVAAELVDLRVGRAPIGRCYMYFRVHDDPEPWRRQVEAVWRNNSREEWSAQPTTHQALEVWKRFLVALQQEPVRMYRTSVKCLNEWVAEFRRKDGTSMLVSTEGLAGRQPETPMWGQTAAGSLTEIVDDMTTWLEADRETGLLAVGDDF
jgi:hypothetical protein